ncbi:MAG: TraR/DksA C4-type zinc finger protein [Candidatus Kerfeldbacteria bacterium]|nr:TraR/DksA C4-type zinc finger protein [Candidatus Kerfeldbacteria bacterium]
MEFDSAFLQSQEKRLREKQAQLQSDLAAISDRDRGHHGHGGFVPKYPEMGSDNEENAAEVAAYESTISAESVLEKNLELVDEALKRIPAGTYGNCVQCRVPIEAARLEALPEASMCRMCASPVSGVHRA